MTVCLARRGTEAPAKYRRPRCSAAAMTHCKSVCTRGAATTRVVSVARAVVAADVAALNQPAAEIDNWLCDDLVVRLTQTREEIAELAEQGWSRPIAEVIAISKLFPYELDSVQKEAFLSHAEGQDVICSMPTGAGKTAIGIFAVWLALLRGRRVFYTTPLKALSNQKRREFVNIFGDSAVGLVTGDSSSLPDAPVVVMTTEILRNVLYPAGASINVGGLHSSRLDLLGSIVIDELHWISDPGRGTVWEELIIYCPPAVGIVGLSATVGGDPRQFCDWVEKTHGRECSFISSSARPVPLEFYVMDDRPFERSRILKLSSFSMDVGAASSTPLQKPDASEDGTRGQTDNGVLGPDRSKVRYTDVKLHRVLECSHMLRRMQRLQWLPGISFLMSRRGCDAKVEDFANCLTLPGRRRPRLVQRSERERISSKFERFVQLHPEVVFSDMAREALLEGAAAHHAGQLPAQRAFVECLFEQGLLKVVFATETLAAGLNMPARSVVLNACTKYDGVGPRLLNGSELLQMTGRAGRRGLDTSGHAIVDAQLQGSKVAKWVMATLDAGPEPLKSHFKPSYAMLCSLLRERTLEEVKQVVSSSFGAFMMSANTSEDELGTSDADPSKGKAETWIADAEELRNIRSLLDGAGVSEQSIEEYMGLSERAAREAELQLRLDGKTFGHSDDDDLDDIFGNAPSLDAASGSEDLFEDDEDELGLSDVQASLEQHEVRKLPEPRREELCRAIKRRRMLRSRCNRKEERPVFVGQGCAHHDWNSFQRYIAVLCDEGYIGLDGGRASVSAAGVAASQLSAGANALWLGSLFLPRPLGGDVIGRFNLSPASIAALVAASSSDAPMGPGAGTNNAGDASPDLLPSDLREAVAWVHDERWRLIEVQWSHGVNEPMPLALHAMVLVFQWASAASWEAISVEARLRGMDDGNLFRYLRRTVEVLRAFSHVVQNLEGTENWRDQVELAYQAMNRSPLTDNLALDGGDLELDLSGTELSASAV